MVNNESRPLCSSPAGVDAGALHRPAVTVTRRPDDPPAAVSVPPVHVARSLLWDVTFSGVQFHQSTS